MLALPLCLGCGPLDPDVEREVTQPITSTTVATSALTGTWSLGPDVIKGLPSPDSTVERDGSPFAQLRLLDDGTFSLQFGAGCVVQGIDGTWVPTATGGLLSMLPNAWQTWTDGGSEALRPTQLTAAREGDFLRITGFDEHGRSIDQRWRARAP